MICQICDKVANNNKGPDDFADLLKLRVTDTRQSFKLKNLTMPVELIGSEIISGYERQKSTLMYHNLNSTLSCMQMK